MKKILIASSIIIGFALLLITTAFISSGFNTYELTNYGNYEMKTTSLNSKDIKLIDCEIIEIDDTRNDSFIDYYENDDVRYEISEDENFIYIKQVGEIKKKGFVTLGKKYGVSISLKENTYSSVYIKSEDLILDIEDVYIENLYITSESSIINLNDVHVNTLNIDSEEIILNIDEIISSSIIIGAEEGLLYLNDIDSNTLDIAVDEGIMMIELAYKQNQYTFDIDTFGICNVVSGGTGNYLINIKSKNAIINLKFD